MSERTTKAIDLDAGQYSVDHIRAYEAVYGRDFVSPGGIAMARECLDALGVVEGERMLDVGCGLGGAAFLAVREYRASVDAIDVSRNMLALAGQRRAALGLESRVRLVHADVLDYAPGHPYDAVYSRDVFLHIAGARTLFERLRALLRPGGRLLFTDYCRAEGPPSDAFARYIAARGYALRTVAEYARLLEGMGFTDVVPEDLTGRFLEILEIERARIDTLDLAPDVAAALRDGWREKIARARGGEQRWGRFRARAPITT